MARHRMMMMTNLVLAVCWIGWIIIGVCSSLSASSSSSLSSLHRSVRCGEDTIVLKVVYPKESNDSSNKNSSSSNNNNNNKNKLPVVLFLGGADCPHESYMWLATQLAEAGYCVVLSSCVVSFGGNLSMLLSTPFDLSMLSSLESYKKNPCSAGIREILQELHTLDVTQQNPLHQRLDLECLVVGGHSSGGRIVLDLVSFDNPFPIKAAFSYGASLVTSNSMGSFAENGSVQQCDRTVQPPLLLMGGSRDGVSARISKFKENDPTESLQRTVDESLVLSKGDVDFIVFRGCNHMVFCSPIDPTCGAVDKDFPLSVEPPLDGDQARRIMGDAIREFCNLHTQRGNDDESGGAKVFQPKIPQELYHTARSIRHTDQTPMSLLSPKQAQETKEDDIEQKQQQQQTWDRLSCQMNDWIEIVVSTLQLKPTTKPITEEFSFSTVKGSLKAWESDKVAWALRYENRRTESESESSSHSLGFNVWLTEAASDAPHLTIHVGVRGNQATIMGDLVPRRDLARDIQQGLQPYKVFETKWNNLQRQAKSVVGLRAFTSSDATVRAIQGPYNFAYVLEDLDSRGKGIQVLGDLLDLYFASWLGMTTTARPATENVKVRDDALRRVLWKHEQAAGERFMDPSLAASLANSMAGYV